MTTPTYGIPDTIGERQSTTMTIGTLSAASSAISSVDLAAGYRIFKITTSAPMRVRLYADSAYLSADAPRAAGTDPTGDHGVMLDVVTTDETLGLVMSPLVDGFTVAGPSSVVGEIVPVLVDGTGVSAVDATVLFDWIKTE